MIKSLMITQFGERILSTLWRATKMPVRLLSETVNDSDKSRGVDRPARCSPPAGLIASLGCAEKTPVRLCRHLVAVYRARTRASRAPTVPSECASSMLFGRALEWTPDSAAVSDGSIGWIYRSLL